MKKSYTEEQRSVVLSLRRKGVTYPEIERITGVPKTTAEWWVKYPTCQLQKLWTREEQEFLKEHYPNAEKEVLLGGLPRWSWEQIVSGATSRKIKRKGIYSKVLLDFSTIDTEKKAYFLGFAAADGCMTKTNVNDNCYVFVISLSVVDYNFLENLKNMIYPDAQIRLEERGKMVRFALGDIVFCNHLISHGIIPRKGKNLNPPRTLPPELLPHYIRGFFDGDGCFSLFAQGNYLSASMTGNKHFLNFINDNFKVFYPHKCNVRKVKDRNSHVILYGGKTGVKFAEYIYQDATIKMDRKYQIAKPYLEGIENGRKEKA